MSLQGSLGLAVRGLLGVGVAVALAAGVPGVAAADTGSSSLSSGATLSAGSSLVSPNGQYKLAMQSDCNLVLYKGGTWTWQTHTYGLGATGCRAAMQTDGNLVVYTPANKALWASATDGSKGSVLKLQDDGNLVIYHGSQAVWATMFGSPAYLADTFGAGAVLKSNEWVYSDNHAYKLVMQGDCNLVLYRVSDSAVKWNSETAGKGSGCWTQMQSDGNLVVYKTGPAAVWNSGTAGKSGAYLDVKDDGTLAVMYGGSAVWASDAASAIRARGNSWISAGVGYSQTSYYTNQYGTYRTDCSGYVSMIWGLKNSSGASLSLTTSTLGSVSHLITKDALQTGDILLYAGDHVVLFDAWANSAHTSYWVYEETPAYGAVHRQITYPYPSNGSLYKPYRKN